MTSTNNSWAFPWRLHNVLEKADMNGFTNIISWLPIGIGFKVHNIKAFEAYIIPDYFVTVKYKSFQRQLQIYGFQRVRQGKDKGAYVHPLFVRNQPELCQHMIRTKIKKNAIKAKQSSVTKMTMCDDNPIPKIKKNTIKAKQSSVTKMTTCDDNPIYEPIPIQTKAGNCFSEVSASSFRVSKELALTISPTIAEEIINILGGRKVISTDLATFA